MKTIKSTALALALTTMTATTASAVVIDFGAVSHSTANSITISQGGYTVTATAVGINGVGTVLANSQVIRTKNTNPNEGGLGVVSQNDTNHEIDGGVTPLSIYKDMLLLTFTTAVKIAKISFSRVDGNDDATFTVDGNAMGTMALSGFDWPNYLSVGFTGTVFGISALQQNDNFKIRSIQVTPIPLPPAVLLLASGIAGICGLSRRKRARIT